MISKLWLFLNIEYHMSDLLLQKDLKDPATKVDITVEQGADFFLDITLKQKNNLPVDLTSYTGRGKIKVTIADSTAAANFTVVFDANRKTGKVGLYLSNATTAALSFNTGVYDFELVSGSGVVTRLIEGRVFFKKEVTK